MIQTLYFLRNFKVLCKNFRPKLFVKKQKGYTSNQKKNKNCYSLPYFPVYGFRYIFDPSSHTISCHNGWISQSSKKSTKFKFKKFNFNMFQFWNFWINSHVFTKFKTICFFVSHTRITVNCQRRTSEWTSAEIKS